MSSPTPDSTIRTPWSGAERISSTANAYNHSTHTLSILDAMIEAMKHTKPVPLPFPIVQTQASATGYYILWVRTSSESADTIGCLCSDALGLPVFRCTCTSCQEGSCDNSKTLTPQEMRLFHYVTSMITLTAAVSYYAMVP